LPLQLGFCEFQKISIVSLEKMEILSSGDTVAQTWQQAEIVLSGDTVAQTWQQAEVLLFGDLVAQT
jgi:hypothetical protein